MSTQALLTHCFHFLLLPLFMGVVVALFSRLLVYRRTSYLRQMIAGVLGSLGGLVLGWIITGRDGHTLGYACAVVFCTLFVMLACVGKSK